MPREIKFRAWNENTKGYCYDAQDAYDTLGWSKAQSKHGYPAQSFGHFFDDDFFVVEQYTGLTDKNGTEIYEGDVVDYKTDKSEWRCKVTYGGPFESDEAVVEYASFTLIGVWPWANKIVKYSMDVLNERYASHLTVVGNIHENGELLSNG